VYIRKESAVDELKHPQYWSSSEDGSFYLRLDALPQPDSIQHNAWMQNVLDLNWPTVLADSFAGKDMVEREDRARMGVYHFLDWIAQQAIFTEEQLWEASPLPIRISDNPDVVKKVMRNLLYILTQNNYLRLMGNQYHLTWNKSAPPEPRKVCITIPEPCPTSEQPGPTYQVDVSESNMQDQISGSLNQGREQSKKLRRILTDKFNEVELRALCLDLGVDYESLPGVGKGEKVRELVAYYERRDSLAELAQTCRQLRPKVPF
jgi:hypothetical protein